MKKVMMIVLFLFFVTSTSVLANDVAGSVPYLDMPYNVYQNLPKDDQEKYKDQVGSEIMGLSNINKLIKKDDFMNLSQKQKLQIMMAVIITETGGKVDEKKVYTENDFKNSVKGMKQQLSDGIENAKKDNFKSVMKDQQQ